MKELKIWVDDPWLEPFKKDIFRLHEKIAIKRQELAGYGNRLYDSVNSYLYYGVHREGDGILFREWAPNATELYLIGDFNGWKRDSYYAFSKCREGNWELRLPAGTVKEGDLFKWLVCRNGNQAERIPAYARRCLQDPETKLFSAQYMEPSRYRWKHDKKIRIENPLIYEAHIGMSSESEGIADFTFFAENVLPRIRDLGYNTLQLMALQEHPYYGSFGYQVANFFALSSRFGTPDEFRMLVDKAHGMGIAVIMDLVHSHSVSNTLEGMSLLDGSEDLYFHSGERGVHPAWNSKCFNYGKSEVLMFLLSNCKFWMEEYRLDGFRFDGVTSMIYLDHGLGRNFTDYSQYFGPGRDEDALVYLALANQLIKEINPCAVTIAEDMSGMPGLAAPYASGGIGFDYRMSMGVPDHWIKWITDLRDEQWNMGEIFRELTNKRADEKTVSYAECHDQALVGDKTIIFRLMDKEMYYSMSLGDISLTVDRGIALHKMIRLATIATAGDGYLNFMGNEFGHPEWIDFPREGNNNSFFYARRQWSLADNPDLRYKFLLEFDKRMIKYFCKGGIFDHRPELLSEDNGNQILVFRRNDHIFAFNFNPVKSFPDYQFRAPAGAYTIQLNTDSVMFGGEARVSDNERHISLNINGIEMLSLYLPCRSAFVLKKESAQ
ncbi:MAG: alpha amylase C-terminal domain-containing protein [Bacteroidales bacterium]|nr:alpha amylase C-terminal domain-containing protein [Bacteroidales bacterium]MDD3989733.1 alpha amylase C-terminal domain-containing protein [Bacteroidales bacterium]